MYNIIMFKAKLEDQLKVYVYLKKNIICDIISKTVLKIKISEKYFDFMNKCNMNEYDSFKNIFSSINHN